MDCPQGCDKITPTHVIGTNKYALESSVCQAAIHNGRTTGHNGGSVTVKFIDDNQPYTGSYGHGITSDSADAANRSMIFSSDLLGCVDGWHKYRESCYYVPGKASENRKTWNEAEALCQKFGGHLASVEDKAESDYIYSMLRANNDLNHVWIGLSDSGHQNYYEKWSDGSPTTFTRWDRNRPTYREGKK